MSEPQTRQDAPEEFHGCARPCWQGLEHTYAYGSCAVAYKVTDAVDAGVTVLGAMYLLDGRKAIEATDIPLIALLPWTRHLPVKERWQMLDEVAASDEPARTVLEWLHTAQAWADPEILEALTRPMKLEDYGEVTEPVCPCGSPCGGHGEGQESSISFEAAEAVAAQLILTERKAREHTSPAGEVPAGDPTGPHPDPTGEGVGYDCMD